MNKVYSFLLSYLVPNILRNIYLMIKYKCIIHPSARIRFIKNLRIGRSTKIGNCDIIAQGRISIGENSLINDYVILNSKNGFIKIGNNVSINNFSIIYGNGGVDIGSNTAIGHSVKIIKDHIIPKIKNTKYSKISEEYTKIGDYVWICANVIVVDGVKIGNNCIIGANSFVNKDVIDDLIVAGTPIRIIKKRHYE